MNRERKVGKKIIIEEPEGESSAQSYSEGNRVETVSVNPRFSTLWQQQEDGESNLFASSSLVAIGNLQSAMDSGNLRGTTSAFERMNKLFDKSSKPDIKIFSSSSSRKIDCNGNVVEQVTMTSRYKEASKVMGYRRNSGVSEEEEVFVYRQLGRRGRETRKVGDGSEYKTYDNYLNCTPEDDETFETEWHNEME
ncbi:hypothetical protein Gasu2_38830 [Galdieria sulphuraria]|nr:hypothetical protein Gasu2_38830 [Galdieria sulphuraria]